jgi:tetratricopeptide (TPR) repeat protein/HEAT repeat protein
MPKTMTTRSLCIALALTSLFAMAPRARADDWGVRRSAFDPRIVSRYKALLNRRPNDGYAMRKLVSLYKRHRSLTALLNEYRALARARPKTYAFQVILGHLYRKVGKSDKAITHYEKAGQLNTKTPAVPAALGALYKKQGKTTEAVTAYKRALVLSSSKRQKKRYLRALANIALVARDMAAAKGYFDKLVALEPRNVFLRIELAQALANSGHEKQAIEQYQSILKRTSDSATKADVLKAIGGLQAKMGQELVAVATYRRAMALTARGHWLRRDLTAKIISIYRQKEDLKALIEHYEKSWKRRGHFEHDVLGRLYAETGDELKALKAFRAALKKAPHAVDTRVALIALLERSGRSKEVITEYRALARRAPGEPKYQIELAKRLYRSGKQKEAVQILERCGQRFPRDASVHSMLGDLYQRWGEYKRAMATVRKLVQIEPRDDAHLINLGEQFWSKGKKRKAIETWRRLLRVIPKRHAAYAKLAEVYGSHEMTKEASDLYRKAIRLKPKHIPYQRAHALLLERKKRTTEALKAWDKVWKLAMAQNKGTFQREARSHIIDVLRRSYQLRTRIRIFKMDFNGAHPKLEAGFLLAEAHLKLGQLEKATQTYKRLLKLDKDNIEAMTALKAVYEKQRRLAEAVTLLKRLAKLQPHAAKEHYQHIAELLLQLYKDKEALFYAKKAVNLGRQDASSYQRLGWLYEKKEDYKEAMKAYAKAIKLSPHRFQAHFALARLLTQHGRHAEADKLYRQVVRSAKTPERIRKAFRLGVDLAGYLGSLQALEKEILPLSITSQNAEVYRRLLVKLYRRRIPTLIDQARQGDADTRARARKALARIGVRGLAPLLEELATSTSNRSELIRILGYLNNPNAVLPLLRIASREAEEQVTTIYGSRASYPYRRGRSRSRSRYRRYRGRGSSRSSRTTANFNARVMATVAVGRIADERATKGLVKLLDNREGPLRDAAAWALGRIPGRRSSAALFNALGDPRTTVQVMACSGLGLIGGKKVRPALEEVMLDKQRHEQVRASCAWGLGALGSTQSVDSLLLALHSGDDLVQRSAAWSLGVIADRKPAPQMVRSLWNKRLEVRQAVIWALVQISRKGRSDRPTLPDVAIKLGKIDVKDYLARLTGGVRDLRGTKLARSLSTVVVAQRSAIADGIALALSKHRDIILRVLTDLDGDPRGLALGPLSQGSHLIAKAERAKLTQTVAGIGTKVRGAVGRLLSHRDPLVRERAISVYAKLGRPADLTARLAQAQGDRDWKVRARALDAVALARKAGALKLEEAARFIQRGLKAKHWRERETAARIAGQLSDRSVSRPLIGALSDPNGFVRQAAALALGRMGEKSAVTALLRSLSDDVPHVRAAACRSLGRLGARTARSQLQQRLKDRSSLVRRAARWALRRLR